MPASKGPPLQCTRTQSCLPDGRKNERRLGCLISISKMKKACLLHKEETLVLDCDAEENFDLVFFVKVYNNNF